MKNHQKLFCLLLFAFIFTFSYGQSAKKNLINNWVSTIKYFDTGDTIKSANEEFHFKADGNMNMTERGMTTPGTWKYLEKTNQLQLTINIAGRSETIALNIDKSTDKDLILTQKRGEKFKTVVYKVK